MFRGRCRVYRYETGTGEPALEYSRKTCAASGFNSPYNSCTGGGPGGGPLFATRAEERRYEARMRQYRDEQAEARRLVKSRCSEYAQRLGAVAVRSCGSLR
jgi:hypothetical protein